MKKLKFPLSNIANVDCFSLSQASGEEELYFLFSSNDFTVEIHKVQRKSSTSDLDLSSITKKLASTAFSIASQWWKPRDESNTPISPTIPS
jgi:hypothetical protein